MTNEAIETLLKAPKADISKGKLNYMMLSFYDKDARAQKLVDFILRNLHLISVNSPFVTSDRKGNKGRNKRRAMNS